MSRKGVHVGSGEVKLGQNWVNMGKRGKTRFTRGKHG